MENTMTPKMLAVDKAVAMYERIKEASCKPDKAISGETLDVYNQLVDWGFIEKYSIIDVDNRWLYVTVIAMHVMGLEDYEKTDSYTQAKADGKWKMIQDALEKSNKISRKSKK